MLSVRGASQRRTDSTHGTRTHSSLLRGCNIIFCDKYIHSDRRHRHWHRFARRHRAHCRARTVFIIIFTMYAHFFPFGKYIHQIQIQLNGTTTTEYFIMCVFSSASLDCRLAANDASAFFCCSHLIFGAWFTRTHSIARSFFISVENKYEAQHEGAGAGAFVDTTVVATNNTTTIAQAVLWQEAHAIAVVYNNPE